MEPSIRLEILLKLYILHRVSTFRVRIIKKHLSNISHVGTSPDHAYGFYGTPLAYTYEFRTGIGTPSRFILPPEQIKDNSEEILDSLLAFVAKAKELGYFQLKI